jgi:hypothetical protein
MCPRLKTKRLTDEILREITAIEKQIIIAEKE